MPRIRRPPTDKPHPLEPIVLKAFAEEPCWDRPKLANYLCGGGVSPGFHSYMVVAKDVLGYMKCQGKLYEDDMGWYRLAKASEGRGDDEAEA